MASNDEGRHMLRDNEEDDEQQHLQHESQAYAPKTSTVSDDAIKKLSIGIFAASILVCIVVIAVGSRGAGHVANGGVDDNDHYFIFDGHNDLPWALRMASFTGRSLDLNQPQPQLHTDIARLKLGKVGAQFWSVWVPASLDDSQAVAVTLEQISRVWQLQQLYPDTFKICLSAADVDAAAASVPPKIASLIGMEGGHSIGGSIEVLASMYKAGARYMTLTHSLNNAWADSATDAPSHNLTAFGKRVVLAMNNMGMLVDLSHVSQQVMSDVLDIAQAPVMFSHSSARALCDHPRNVPDSILSRVKANGGVVMVNFYPVFISNSVRLGWKDAAKSRTCNAEMQAWADSLGPSKCDASSGGCTGRASVQTICDHIDHIKRIAGVQSVGFGADFDGIGVIPSDASSVASYPDVIKELRARGWSSADITAITSGNIMRVLRAAGAKAGSVTVPPQPTSPAPPGGGNPRNLGSKSAPVAVAQQVVGAMNTQVDPCDDFYEYSCGGWNANNDIPSDKSSWYRSFSVLDDEAKKAVEVILTQAAKTEKPVQLYDMCMNTDAVNRLGAAPLLPLLQSLASAWASLPAVEDSVSLLHRGATSSFFSFYVDADPVDPTRYSLTMYQGGMTLPTKDYYVYPQHAAVRDAFKAFVKDVFVAMAQDGGLGSVQLPWTSATAAAAAADVFDVEMQIANVSNFNYELRNSEAMYNPTTLAAMTTPGLFSFTRWASGLVPPAPPLSAVITTTRTYFPAISSIISRLASSDQLKLKRYLTWRAALPALPLLSTTYNDLHFQFFGKVLSGAAAPPPRATSCVTAVNSLLGFDVGRIYVEKFFSPQQRAAVEDLATRIEQVFGAGLPSWLSAAGRAAALSKLAKVKSKIGYPGEGEWKNYSAYVVVQGRFGATVMGMRAAEQAEDLQKVYTLVNRKEWFMTPQTVNAYYSPSTNDINFPAAILQPPFFSDSYPADMNYGALGMVVGHELTHGFDDDGRRFNGDGQLDPSFWPAADVQAFDARAGCVVNEYNKFKMTFPGGVTMSVNGNLTLGENLADLGGIELAFRALQQHSADRGASPRLVPELSGNQLFFVAFAQGWCGRVRDALAMQRLASDPHSPGPFRVKGPVMNSKAFAQSFGCCSGSSMNPATKCSVWTDP